MCDYWYKVVSVLQWFSIQRYSYLIDIEIFSEKGSLLCGCLSAVIGQDLSEGCYCILWLAKCKGLTTDCEVDMVFSQRPAPLLVHLHGLAVTAQCMLPLQRETTERAKDRRKRRLWGIQYKPNIEQKTGTTRRVLLQWCICQRISQVSYWINERTTHSIFLYLLFQLK